MNRFIWAVAIMLLCPGIALSATSWQIHADISWGFSGSNTTFVLNSSGKVAVISHERSLEFPSCRQLPEWEITAIDHALSKYISQYADKWQTFAPACADCKEIRITINLASTGGTTNYVRLTLNNLAGKDTPVVVRNLAGLLEEAHEKTQNECYSNDV